MVKSKWAVALIGVLAMGALSISAARADEEIIETALTQPAPIKACNDGSVDLRSAVVGFKCRTSKGGVFERVAKDAFGEAWRGPDGLIWSDFVGWATNDGEDKDGFVVDSAATRLCAKVGGMLPLRADFERGEANGFREVLPNMKEVPNFYVQPPTTYGRFWSSTADPDAPDGAYVFFGDRGAGIPDYFRSASQAVRCTDW